MIEWERMKTALVALNVSYIHKNLALRWLYVTKPAHHEAKIFEGLTKDPLQLVDEILAYAPTVVAFSVYIFNVDATCHLIRTLKSRCPDLLLVAGGPEATYNPQPLWDAGIDRIYRGEAELVFWKDLDGENVNGVMRHPQDHAEVLRADLAELERNPSPYFLDLDHGDMDRRYLYVESSRGCPFGCAYCLAAQDPKVRTFSEPYMARFFETLRQTPVRQIKFLDRTFNLNKERALRLAQQCLELPQGLNVHVELVGDRLDEALIQLFLDHPERFRVELGVQSLNPVTLGAVGRVSDLPKLMSVVDRFAQSDVLQHTDLIAGLPQEDLDSFQASYNGLIRRHPHEVQVGILKVLHGSTLQVLRNAEGYRVDAKAPYTVRQTPWMSEADLATVEAVALATEKAYNSQKFRHELRIVFQIADPFVVMARIGSEIQKLPRPYTNQAFYRAILDALASLMAPQKAQALVLHAYLRGAKTLPPKLVETHPDKRILNAVRQQLNLPDSIKHLVITDRIDDVPGYLVWGYGSTPQHPIPWMIEDLPPLEKDIV